MFASPVASSIATFPDIRPWHTSCLSNAVMFSIFVMGDRTGSYHDMVAQVRRADALGFHGVWLGERHLANGDLLWPAPTVAAAYMAAVTQRIRIGIAARVLPFHHPLHVAAEALTLDVLSKGRFDLGITRGSMDEVSHAAFGVGRDEARVRFDEQLEVLRRALRGEPFSHRGRAYTLERVVSTPRPVQRPGPPLFIVANNPASLDAAAESGDPVFVNGALDEAAVAATVDRYLAGAAAAGLRATAGDLLLNRFIYVGETDAAAHQVMRGPFMEFLDRRAPDLRAFLEKRYGAGGVTYELLAREICIFGDAATCARRLASLRRRTGVQHILCTFNLITLDHQRCVESMERFAEEVMPRLTEGTFAQEPDARAAS